MLLPSMCLLIGCYFSLSKQFPIIRIFLLLVLKLTFLLRISVVLHTILFLLWFIKSSYLTAVPILHGGSKILNRVGLWLISLCLYFMLGSLFPTIFRYPKLSSIAINLCIVFCFVLLNIANAVSLPFVLYAYISSRYLLTVAVDLTSVSLWLFY